MVMNNDGTIPEAAGGGGGNPAPPPEGEHHHHHHHNPHHHQIHRRQQNNNNNNNLELGNNFVFFHRAPHVAANEPPAAAAAVPPAPRRPSEVVPPPPPPEMEEMAYEVNDDGVIEGGVAVGSYVEGGRRLSRDCDLVLLIECNENLQTLPTSIGKISNTISIGLDKNTKLSSVFQRFADILTSSSRNREPISVSDIEFVHNEILQGKETAEISALMKNDRIKARRSRARKREEEMEKQRIQRESDRMFFRHMRSLLPDLSVGGTCDVVLDCRGRLMESGMEQMVLSTAVRAHSAIVARRCPWLGEKMKRAREERDGSLINRIPSDLYPACYGNNDNRVHNDDDDDDDAKSDDRKVSSAGREVDESGRIDDDLMDTQDSVVKAASASMDVSPSSEARPFAASAVDMDNNDDNVTRSVAAEDEDDDDDSVQPYPMQRDHGHHHSPGRAAKVVAEDDDLFAFNNVDNRPNSPVLSSLSNLQNMLWVTLDDHPPEAVKLLLEFCYTNRCIPLGQSAFVQASKGAVSPYHPSAWPKAGRPTVSMGVTLAGITLAEEARMPRLSLMCEIAASHLLSNSTILDALSLCTTQYHRTGNKLPILRKATMQHLLQRPVLMEVSSNTNFIRTLNEERDLIVPSLLVGAQEVVPAPSKKRSRGCDNLFQLLDEEDKVARSIERHKYREERRRAAAAANKNSDEVGWNTYEVMAFQTAARTSSRVFRDA